MAGINFWEWLYSYIVVFHGEYDMEYSPVLHLKSSKDIPKFYRKSMHLVDNNIVNAFYPLEYVLHLPRVTLDLHRLDVDVIEKSHDTAHNIWLIPDSLFTRLSISQFHPTGIFITDDCSLEVMEYAKSVPSLIGVHWARELNEELLRVHWKDLCRNEKLQNSIQCIEKQYLLLGDVMKALPQANLSRQAGRWSENLTRIYNSDSIEMTCFEIQMTNNCMLQTAIKLARNGEDEVTDITYQKERDKVFLETVVNVVLMFPGIPRVQNKYGKRSLILPKEEKRCLRIMGVHRAIAKDAVYIELPCASRELFNELNELEMFCKNGRINGRKIKKSLYKIGKLLKSQLTLDQKKIIFRAKSITAFTDFPIGLAVLEKGMDPLLCCTNISYRPITPLTRNLNIELEKHSQLYWGASCRVLYLECIPKNQENLVVREISDYTYKVLLNLSQEYENFHIIYEETTDLPSFKSCIKEMGATDILYISAHGFYNREVNSAGLWIGEDLWFADDNDLRMPPVVILSACHTAPRGSGAVNPADLLMRMGAEAVLGTFIPINAHRNMILMTRLFTYIVEAQRGSKQYATLSDAWTGVVATNAIHELVNASPKFKAWMHEKNMGGVPRMFDFQLYRSVGRLHRGRIYTDTIDILKEMLEEEGMEGKFDDVLSQNAFFPESFFYQFIGYPENIFLHNEVFEELS